MNQSERQAAVEAAKRQIALRDAAPEPLWFASPRIGEPGHSFMAQVFGADDHALAEFNVKDGDTEAAALCAASRSDKSPEAVIALADECERLRGALERVEKWDLMGLPNDHWKFGTHMVEEHFKKIARDALSGTTP